MKNVLYIKYEIYLRSALVMFSSMRFVILHEKILDANGKMRIQMCAVKYNENAFIKLIG